MGRLAEKQLKFNFSFFGFEINRLAREGELDFFRIKPRFDL